MDGLKYILKEIEARRGLLHDFQKSMNIANSKEFILAPSLSATLKMVPEFLKGESADAFQRAIEESQKGIEDLNEFTLFSEGLPNFVFDGLLIYKATPEALPVMNLTVKDFNALYKRQFNDLQECRTITIPLRPNPPPENYQIIELLQYRLGGGICDARLSVHIWSPAEQPKRQFSVSVDDRYVPEQRSSPKTEKGVAITPEAYPYNWWEQDAGEQAKMARGMEGAFLYNWWERDRRKARPQDWPAEIIINKDTKPEQIWGQLLLSAWGHNYFNKLGQTKAYEELKRYYSPIVMDRILMHLQKHSFNPYDAKSSLAYLKRLVWEYNLEHYREETKDRPPIRQLEEETVREGMNHLSSKVQESIRRNLKTQKYSNERPGESIAQISFETGIPKRTIYQLIKEGKIEADSSNSDPITLSDYAVDNLKKRAERQNKRKAIFELAKREGKSHEVIKKWLHRHRDLPEDEFKNGLCSWLGLDSPSKQN